MFFEHEIAGNKLTLNLATADSLGPPLLFLHGVGRRWQDFLPIFPALQQRWRIHALDFRGHGKSERATTYDVVDYAGDVVKVLRKQFKTPTVIYGHSLGALVAAAVAQGCPDLVKAVVLEDPPAEPFLKNIRGTAYYSYFFALQTFAGRSESIQATTRELAEIRMTTADGKSVRLADLRDGTALRFMARCLLDMDPQVFTPLIEGRWLDGYDWKKVFSGIPCPTLLLCADIALGGMLPKQDAETTAALIPDCTLISVPSTGHLIHWMQAETTCRLVVGFLESL